MDFIREQDPLKQGLKPLTIAVSPSRISSIREQDPLKQGLKPHFFTVSGDAFIIIREQDPLKQGLKPHDTPLILLYHFIREQDPLKQGLKLEYIRYSIRDSFKIFVSKIH